MNVLILAGGYAKRLWPLTNDFPKTLLKVAGKPVLYHLLYNVARIAGVTSVTISVDANKHAFFEENISEFNTVIAPQPLIVSHDLVNGEPMGPLAKIKQVLDKKREYGIEGDEFLMLGGDNVFCFNLQEFCSFYRQKRTSCIAVHRVFEDVDASSFGVPTVDASGRVTDFAEKPNQQRSRNVSTACYGLRSADLSSLKPYLHGGGEDSLGGFVRSLARGGTVEAFRFDEDWYDTGTREALLAANASLMRRNPPQPKDHLLVGDAKVIEPVIVERTADVSGCVIGPNVYIGADTKITDSRIENSIVYDGCSIRKCDMRNTVVGSGACVEGYVTEGVLGPGASVVVDRE